MILHVRLALYLGVVGKRDKREKGRGREVQNYSKIRRQAQLFTLSATITVWSL